MPVTILIVDDDPDDLWLFCEALHEIDPSYRCLTALNGIEALQLLENLVVAPDFIFIDLNLPFMSGRECLIELKKTPRLANIPVIIYSTSKLKTDIDEVYKLGAVFFLTKPNSFQDIVKKVSAILAGKWEEIDY